jgi:serine/threonine-protein kinase
MPRVGSDYAGYQIQGIVGRGGMSVVYQAEHPRLARVVALKVLAAELAEDDRFRERFVRESKLAASLDHPNIVPIYDAGAANGLLYIAMRFVKGDLKSLLQREGRLRPARVLRLMMQAASALDSAHRLGLVHRDVKPANILIAFGSGPEGADHAYLADFGLAKHATSHSGITATGQFVGTVDYMAPEQIEGRPLDARTDVYALGCILFECLTGKTPFTRDTDAALIWAHLREEPPRVRDSSRDVPPGVDEVVVKAMAKASDQRFPSCMALVSAFRDALADDAMQSAISRGSEMSHEMIAEDPSGRAATAAMDDGDALPSTNQTITERAQPLVDGEKPGVSMTSGQVVSTGPLHPTTSQSQARDFAAGAEAIQPPGRSSARIRSRLTWLVPAAVLGLAVVVLVVWLGLGGKSTSSRGQAMTVKRLDNATHAQITARGPFPDPVEALLLVPHVGATRIVDWQCHRFNPGGDVLRALTCDELPRRYQVAKVDYLLYHDGGLTKQAFRREAQTAATGGKDHCFPSGSNDPWWGRWSAPAETWTHSFGSNEGTYRGLVLCKYSSEGVPEMWWVDYSTKILAEAVGKPGFPDQLKGWWQEWAGPGHPAHVHTLYAQGEFPISGFVSKITAGEGSFIRVVSIRTIDQRVIKVYFRRDIKYECPLSHLQDHLTGRSEIDLPVKIVDGRKVVTHFTHC